MLAYQQKSFMLVRLTGIQIGIFSSFVFALMAYWIHLVPDEMNVYSILFTRSLFISVLLFPWGIRYSPHPFKKASIVLWLRASGGVIAILCFYWNLTQISVTHSFLFGNFTPIIVLFLARFFLNERLKMIQIIGVLLTIFAVFFPRLIGLNLHQYELIHMVVGTTGAFALAVASVSLRQASKNFHPFTIVFWMTTLGCIVSGTILSIRGEWATQWSAFLSSWGLMLGICIASIIGQITRTIYYQRLSASVASTVGLLALIWGMGLEILIDHYELELIELISILAAVFGILLTQASSESWKWNKSKS